MLCQLSYDPEWLGRKDSNLRVRESKSRVLPLDDAPVVPRAGFEPAYSVERRIFIPTTAFAAKYLTVYLFVGWTMPLPFNLGGYAPSSLYTFLRCPLPTPRYSDDELSQAVAASSSIRGVLQLLDLAPAGGNYATVHRKIAALSISTAHFTGQSWRRGKAVGPRRAINEYLVENSPTGSHKLKTRLIKAGLLLPVCAVCGLVEWRGLPAPLELDHIDGRHSNNRLDNLRLLCPNCHAQTPTYRGKNKKPRA